MSNPKPVTYVTSCQVNSTFYLNKHQAVPYDKARKLEAYYEKAWSSIQPPYASSFTLADAQTKLKADDAKTVFNAVVNVRGRALPGNNDSSDQGALTAIHNLLGAMFMADMIDGNQVTLLSDDFRDAKNRATARNDFNSHATEYKLPVAMFVSGVVTPENLGNFEGVCYKVATKR